MPGVFDESLYFEDTVELESVNNTTDVFSSDPVQLYTIDEITALNFKVDQVSISTSSAFYLDSKNYFESSLKEFQSLNSNLVYLNTFTFFNSFLLISSIVISLIVRRR